MTQGGAVGAGRSTAIVLFTDLVGSTELRSRLGEDAAEKLRHRHDALVAGAVGASRGNLVKNLGDGIMATFVGASDAVGAAVGIQQAIGRDNRSSAEGLEVRIGISAGDVVFEGDDCFGTPVIEAARLCGAAAGGQILASELVRGLARSSAGTFTPVGSLELKGLPEPVPAVQVEWEPLPQSSVPLPSFLTDIGRIFVGRDGELERLGQLWKETVAGEKRVVFLAGEPGVGKTRLAAELAVAGHEQGGIVLAGRCDEDLGVPYQPFVEALRHYATHAASPRLGRHGGELTRLVPELRERVAGLAEPLRSDPETERYRLFDAVAAWLGDASAEAPVLLILDDVHWAAKPTLLLLRHVLRSAESLRLLVVVTYRDTDIGRGDPLTEFLADLRREGGGERVPLTGLDRAGVGAFIERAAGHSLPDGEGEEFIRAVWEETEGNPFFVAEVIRHLTESGGVEQRDGRWVVMAPVEQLGIPEGVRDVVGRRLSRLPPGTDRILGVAAVAGLEFEPAVVVAAGGFTEDELFSALEGAAAARLVGEVLGGTRYRFAHALVRATLYDEISGPRRVVLHRKVAEAIERVHGHHLDDHLPALAHHWARASAPAADTDRAVEYTTRAGDRALALLAHDEAVGYYRQALELLDLAERTTDEGRRLELLMALGEAQRRAGEPAYRETLLSAARLAQERGDADALARAALANSRGMMQSSVVQVDHDRVAALQAALSASDSADSPQRARLLATLALELTASGDSGRLALSDEALAMARRLGDHATLTHVLTARFYTFISPSTLATRLADTAELVTAAERLGDPMAIALAHFVRARVNSEQGDVNEARAHLEVTERIATELGQPTLRWYTTWARAAYTLLSGRLAEAESFAMEAGRLAEATGQPDGPLFLAAQLFAVRSEQGRLEEVEAIWVEAVQRFPEATYPRAMLALLLAELDRPVEAQALLEDLARADFTLIPANNLWLIDMACLAVVAARSCDQTRATLIHELIAPYAAQIAGVGPCWVGSVSHYIGLLATTVGRFDEAEAHFRMAETTHQRIGAPTLLARTRLEWAQMLVTRRQPGDAEGAEELLRQALATARELGLANVERRAIALLSSD